MINTRHAATALTLLACVSTGCSSDGEPSGEQSPPRITDGTPSATASSAEDLGPEEALALEAVRSRYGVVDRLLQDSDLPLRLLTSVSTGAQLAGEQALVRREREKGRRQVGDTEVIEIKVESVSPTTGSRESATIVVDACWDVSDVDVLDASGTSVITPERPNRGWTRFTVTEVGAGSASGGDGGSEWLVATGRDLEREPCSGD